MQDNAAAELDLEIVGKEIALVDPVARAVGAATAPL
jgi:hypothetical protein